MLNITSYYHIVYEMNLNDMRDIIILMMYWIKLKKRNETILINQCET